MSVPITPQNITNNVAAIIVDLSQVRMVPGGRCRWLLLCLRAALPYKRLLTPPSVSVD